MSFADLHPDPEELARRYWPRVNSTVGRRMMLAAWRALPKREGQNVLDWKRPGVFSPDLEYYQMQLRRRLQGSDLAQRMAYGIDMLPDIYPAMPWWLHSIEKLRRPRTPEAVVHHVTRYLDIYLASRDVPARYYVSRFFGNFTRPLLLLCFVGLLMSLMTAYSIGIWSLIPVLTFAWMIRAMMSSTALVEPSIFDIQSIELFLHMLDAYKEPNKRSKYRRMAREAGETLDELVESLELDEEA